MHKDKVYKRAFQVIILLVLLIGSGLTQAQDADDSSTPVITAENVGRLQSARQMDFVDLPDGYNPAAGLFVMNEDASRIVSFASQEGAAPMSQAVIWDADQEPVLNTIDDSHHIRILSPDGRCLATGHTGYYAVWELNPEAPGATLIARRELRDGGDSVINMWWAEPCTPDIFVEVFAASGETYILRPEEASDPLYTGMFDIPGRTLAGRVGRVQPPLAITMDFENRLYRWDMESNNYDVTIDVDDFAIFGAVNADGSYYAWQNSDFTGLNLVDFDAETSTSVTIYTDVYFAHLTLTPGADVILGIDPTDARGTVQAIPVADGERLSLGDYRHCERTQPDLAQLSADGTSLVIGCDEGLDVWRVIER